MEKAFGYRQDDGGNYVVYAVNGADKKDCIIMVPKAQLYKRGLEARHSPLVDMEQITKALVTTLNSYSVLTKLRQDNWVTIIHVYEHFIDKKLKYRVVMDFLEAKGDEWE